MYKKLAQLQDEIKKGSLTIEQAQSKLTTFDRIMYYSAAVLFILCGIATTIIMYQGFINNEGISKIILGSQPIFLGFGIAFIRSKNAGLDTYKVRGFQTKALLLTGVLGVITNLLLVPIAGVLSIMVFIWGALAVVAYIVGKVRKLW